MDAPRRLEHRYRVRFDEADSAGRLRPSGLLRYAQDMASLHSEEAGFDREWYQSRAMLWLVRNVSLSIRDTVTYGDLLAISSEIIGQRHVWARRQARIRRADPSGQPLEDELVAVVDTDWVLLTTEGRPARVPGEMAHFFSAGTTFTRNRVVLSETPADTTTLVTRVRPADVDPMGHMNNAAYLDVVEEARAQMPTRSAGRAPDCYRIGYLRPALPDSAVNVACWRTQDGAVACRISDGDGEELTRVLVSWTAA